MNGFIQRQLDSHQAHISGLCARLGVRELRVFGSAVSDAFDPSSSDLDFLVEFENPEASGISDRFMALAEGLEAIFERPVDLVTRQAMKNPVFRQTVEQTSQPLYAA